VVNEQSVEMMTKRIVDKFNPNKVILFGSFARGEAKQNSDVDLLIIMDCQSDKKRVANLDDINRYQEAWWTVYYPAIKEGKVLYERG
jgi:predicted nucleotidyltransferase